MERHKGPEAAVRWSTNKVNLVRSALATAPHRRHHFDIMTTAYRSHALRTTSAAESPENTKPQPDARFASSVEREATLTVNEYGQF